MTRNEAVYDVWWSHAESEESMEDEHRPGWDEVIRLMPETDLSACKVLDFGCNRGGFLRHLHQARPFAQGVGVDLGAESVKLAEQRKGALPLTYANTGSPEALGIAFDLAFALSVIYLVGDLPEHARKIAAALRPGGVYYVTYTDLSDNASAAFFKREIERYSRLEAHMHALDDFADAFAAAGFQTQAMRRQPSGFLTLGSERDFFRSSRDYVKSQYEETYLLRFSLSPGLAGQSERS
ncbi:class I SAM-dependent methyltransferase [Paenibacillus sp. IB182496]|uniref:Class I SAM-dependent methyltransferase n=1 Tax=Paenibacillus sabuli TaxID=2772509 RepID=A0A927BYL6_9BACL|nr:class I SAM-dependent methyltransferase [Paenibacillus sabuli]MBD2847809.1 class I SAM-dependent methyltransferase [Paenibacillus sabuli]